MIEGLPLEVEGVQSCCHLEKAALWHADGSRPDAHGCLVDTQFTDIVGPGDGVPLGQHHGVAAGGCCYPRWVWQLGWGRRCQRREHRGVHSLQVLKEPLHHLVPMTVVVLQGHLGDLKHRAECMRGLGLTKGDPARGCEAGKASSSESQEGTLAGSSASNRKLSQKKLLIKTAGLVSRTCHPVNSEPTVQRWEGSWVDALFDRVTRMKPLGVMQLNPLHTSSSWKRTRNRI